MTHSYDLVPGVMRVLPTASGRSQPDSGLGRYGDRSAPFCAAIGNSVAAPGKLRYLRALGELSLLPAQCCWKMELSPLIKNTCRSFMRHLRWRWVMKKFQVSAGEESRRRHLPELKETLGHQNANLSSIPLWHLVRQCHHDYFKPEYRTWCFMWLLLVTLIPKQL